MFENIVPVLKRNTSRTPKQGGGFLHLFVSKRLIQGAAVALLGIFVPIFLYETSGFQFHVVGLYYALLSFMYAVFLVPGMYVTNRIGFSHTLILGGVFSVFIYGLMYVMTPENIWTLLPILAVAITGFRVWHWVPYHVDFTLFTSNGERGRVVSLSFATIAFMGVIGPILAGFIIQHAGYDALFGTAIVLLIAATISYAFVPEVDATFEWGFFETWRNIFSKRFQAVTTGEFANGIEIAITTIVWPIFLFEVLQGNVFEIGALSTVIVAVTIVIQLFVGKYLDGKEDTKIKTLKWGSKLYALGWIAKIFVLSAAQIFFVGLYHNVVRIFTKTPFSAILYDMSADQGKYVDEFTVLREMSSHLGRTIALVLIAILSFYMPIGWTFVLAAAASLALNMVYHIARE